MLKTLEPVILVSSPSHLTLFTSALRARLTSDDHLELTPPLTRVNQVGRGEGAIIQQAHNVALGRRVGTAVIVARRDCGRALEVCLAVRPGLRKPTAFCCWRTRQDEGDSGQGNVIQAATVMNGYHSQTSKERQPTVLVHWFAQPGTSYRAMLIQFIVNEVAFCAMAAWLPATRR